MENLVLEKIKHLCITDALLPEKENFYALWPKSTILYWTFDEESLSQISRPLLFKVYFRSLLFLVTKRWQHLLPITIVEDSEKTDFTVRICKDRCLHDYKSYISSFRPNSVSKEIAIDPDFIQLPAHEQQHLVSHELIHILGFDHSLCHKIKLTMADSSVKYLGNLASFKCLETDFINKVDKLKISLIYRWFWEGKLQKINEKEVHCIE